MSDTVQTVFCGGCCDSEWPRKVHLLNEETGGALCGQFFPTFSNVEESECARSHFFGNEACQKCFRLLSKQEQPE